MVQPTFFRKILAFILDMMTIYIFILPGFESILGRIIPAYRFGEAMELYARVSSDQVLMMRITLLSFLISVYILLYFSLSEYLLGASFGILLLGMSVVGSNKRKPGLFACVVRNLFCLPYFPFIILWVLDPLFLMLKKNGQRLTEFWTKTRVIYSG